MNASADYPRDLAGYGRRPPQADWPGGARIAVQFVLNLEEGGESCVLHGDAGTNGSTVVREVADDAPQAARRWVVVVWNDPVNLMTYVTYVFRKLFGYSQARAQQLMLQVHHEGRAVVATGTLERCEYDATRLHAHGLCATIAEE